MKAKLNIEYVCAREKERDEERREKVSCSQPQWGVTSTPLFCDNGVDGQIEEPTILLSSSAQPSCLASGLLPFIL